MHNPQCCMAMTAAILLVLSPWADARAGNHLGTYAPDTDPSVSTRFDPATVAPNAPTLVTITLTNPNATPATLTGELDDDLPAPVVIGGGAGATTCPNGNVSAIGGFAIFALGLGAQIPAQGSCTVTVCVMGPTSGMYTNTIPAGGLQTDMGGNVDAASAILAVSDDVIFAARFDGQCAN